MIPIRSGSGSARIFDPVAHCASHLVAFVSVKENIQRANNVIIVYLERLAFVSVKENIQSANNVIIVYLER